MSGVYHAHCLSQRGQVALALCVLARSVQWKRQHRARPPHAIECLDIIYPRSMPRVTGPAPSCARAFPNCMRRSRSSSEIRKRPNLCSRRVRLADLDRPIRLPTSCRSSRCSLIRSPIVFASRDLVPWRARRDRYGAQPRAPIARRLCGEKVRKVSLTYFPFRLTWTRQEPDLSFVKVAKTCALRVH